jgi:hypothetical protein
MPGKDIDVMAGSSAASQRREAARVLAAALLCLPLAAGCSVSEAMPSIAVIQSAYDDAKLEEQDRHDDQLRIEEADCRPLHAGKYSCQVGFTDKRSTSGRLYFDVIGMDRLERGWRLVSGLCRR